jgi:hypothetical protein
VMSCYSKTSACQREARRVTVAPFFSLTVMPPLVQLRGSFSGAVADLAVHPSVMAFTISNNNRAVKHGKTRYGGPSSEPTDPEA